MRVERPASDEYGAYYANYINKVPEGDILVLLAQQIDSLCLMLAGLSDEQANYRFGPNEWSIKEVVGHMNDAERVFAYRTLRFSRGDETPLPGFDQDIYVKESNYSQRSLADLLQEFELLRRANLLVFKNLSPEAYLRRGTASNYPFTVRALLYIMVGHVNHHVGSLRTDYSIA
jgi:uncharacterized damage-inducible protein DinB